MEVEGSEIAMVGVTVAVVIVAMVVSAPLILA